MPGVITCLPAADRTGQLGKSALLEPLQSLVGGGLDDPAHKVVTLAFKGWSTANNAEMFQPNPEMKANTQHLIPSFMVSKLEAGRQNAN